jgi:hypothetical protein
VSELEEHTDRYTVTIEGKAITQGNVSRFLAEKVGDDFWCPVCRNDKFLLEHLSPYPRIGIGATEGKPFHYASFPVFILTCNKCAHFLIHSLLAVALWKAESEGAVDEL